MNEELMLEKQLEELRGKHRRLDDEIQNIDHSDQFKLLRLKKEKLKLRDIIVSIEERLYPDIIA